MDRQQIITYVNDNRLIEAGDALRTALSGEPATADRAWALYMLGRIAWKEGRSTDAITLYNTAIEADPASEARVALAQATQVLNFYHKDLYTP